MRLQKEKSAVANHSTAPLLKNRLPSDREKISPHPQPRKGVRARGLSPSGGIAHQIYRVTAMRTKTVYFWLGFSVSTTVSLSTLVAYLPGKTERGSGRIDFTETLIAEAQGQQKPDREPDPGNKGRRD